MKSLFIIIFSAAAILFSSFTYAQRCGTGHIIEIKEGGWNTDDFMIKVQTSATNAPSLFHGFVRFSATDLSQARLDAIRRLATTAFALNAKVWTYSHTGSCSSATELSMRQ